VLVEWLQAAIGVVIDV